MSALEETVALCYLMCKRLGETPRNVTVEVPVIDGTGARIAEIIRTAKEFFRPVDGRDCIRVTPRPEFPQGRGVTVETLPTIAGDLPQGAGALVLVSEADLIYTFD